MGKNVVFEQNTVSCFVQNLDHDFDLKKKNIKTIVITPSTPGLRFKTKTQSEMQTVQFSKC
jgi:hypothetical protein